MYLFVFYCGNRVLQMKTMIYVKCKVLLEIVFGKSQWIFNIVASLS